ncbi:MAG: CDP-glycerol glycerophosphotransferase family protein [Candidatus Omnitrophota bacterium]
MAFLKEENRFLIGILSLLFGNLLYLMSFFIPKSKNIWVFGAWFGGTYSDNSKYLFEYVNKNQPGIRAIWLTTSKNTLELLRKKGYKAYRTYSLRGCWLSMRAKVGVICVSNRDINWYTMAGKIIVNLWYGAPLKKVVYDDTITYERLSGAHLFFFPFLKKKWDLVVAPSHAVKKIMAGALRIPGGNIAVTGYPRNDVFFKEKTVETPFDEKLSEYRKKGLKIGIYMPTHRKEGRSSILSLLVDEIEDLNLELKKKQVILLVKLHYYHLKEIEKLQLDHSNIYFIKNEDIEQDIYSILPLTDFMITDYSSVYFDYLLLDRPVIFAPFDMDDYIKVDRELYYDYNEITPGPKANSWKDVLRWVDDCVSSPDKYRSDRERVREIIHEYRDGDNSKRVYEKITGLL